MIRPTRFALAFILSACVAPTSSRDPITSEASTLRVEGTPEAMGVLAFLNHSGTTLSILDDHVPLDRRAAASLVEHRDGADARWGTEDDDLYDSLAEVDAQPWVGDAAIEALFSYCALTGWIPEGHETLGSWDDVPFSVDQAEATLALANETDERVLDHDLGLDQRAVRSIVEERPLASIQELSELHYVGTAALSALKNAATGSSRDICQSERDCEVGEACIGEPDDGTADHGRCADVSDLPGEGATCSLDEDCNRGLSCIGQSLGDGWCAHSWATEEFENPFSLAIPDDGIVVASSIVVTGLAPSTVGVTVTLDVLHDRPEDLQLALISPDGGVSLLWVHDETPSYRVSVPTLSGSAANGTWILAVQDGDVGVGGVLRRWSLTLSSDW